jgi:hypothetical protein
MAARCTNCISIFGPALERECLRLRVCDYTNFARACDNGSAKHPGVMCRMATLKVRDARHERARYTHDDARLVAYM